MGYVTLEEIAAASVPTPASGKNNLFFDTAEGALKVKDDVGLTLFKLNFSATESAVVAAPMLATG